MTCSSPKICLKPECVLDSRLAHLYQLALFDQLNLALKNLIEPSFDTFQVLVKKNEIGIQFSTISWRMAVLTVDLKKK